MKYHTAYLSQYGQIMVFELETYLLYVFEGLLTWCETQPMCGVWAKLAL